MKYEAAKETRSVGFSRKTVTVKFSSSSVRPGGIIAPGFISRQRQEMKERKKEKLVSYVHRDSIQVSAYE